MDKDITTNEEVMKELNGIKQDKIIATFEIERNKTQLYNTLINSKIGEEIKNCNLVCNQVYKLKIPFKQKLKNIINRLKFILQND